MSVRLTMALLTALMLGGCPGLNRESPLEPGSDGRVLPDLFFGEGGQPDLGVGGDGPAPDVGPAKDLAPSTDGPLADTLPAPDLPKGECDPGVPTSCPAGLDCVAGTRVCRCIAGGRCGGCCASATVCQPSPTVAACGSGGNSCSACDASKADSCSATGECRCGASAPCAGAQLCSGGQCVAQCTDQCSSGATKCVGERVQTCVTLPTGCLGWSASVDCPTAQTCQGTKCVNLPPMTASYNPEGPVLFTIENGSAATRGCTVTMSDGSKTCIDLQGSAGWSRSGSTWTFSGASTPGNWQMSWSDRGRSVTLVPLMGEIYPSGVVVPGRTGLAYLQVYGATLNTKGCSRRVKPTTSAVGCNPLISDGSWFDDPLTVSGYVQWSLMSPLTAFSGQTWEFWWEDGSRITRKITALLP